MTLALNNANFGVEAGSLVSGVWTPTYGDCSTTGTVRANFISGNVVEGMVPTVTPKLPDDYAIDGWGNRIMYSVDNRYTASNAFIYSTIPIRWAMWSSRVSQ